MLNLTIALSVLAALVAVPAAFAAQPLLSRFCEQGAVGGQCENVAGVATNPATGDLYVVDREQRRINQFTAWGEFVRAWGGGVVTGGASGTGVLTKGSPQVTAVTITSKQFLPGMEVEGDGIAPGTRIAAVGFGDDTLVLSSPATATTAGPATAIASPEAAGNVPVDELQRIEVTATSGTFNLDFEVLRPDGGVQTTTANLPYNASAAEAQSALEGLAAIGPGNVAVTSANAGGQPGVPGGPYLVEFGGARYSDTDVRGLRVAPGSIPLSGGTASVEPVRQGASAPEVCTGGDCRTGVDGQAAGQFATPLGIGVDSEGSVYVFETPACIGGSGCVETFDYTGHGNSRVQKFDSDGDFLLMFGGEVDQGPNHPGNLCTAAYLTEGEICGGGKRSSGNGEFGIGPVSPPNNLEPGGDRIEVGPDDEVYVGGMNRIQVFDRDGGHLRSVPVAGSVASLGVDRDPASQSFGDPYVSYFTENLGGVPDVVEDVRRLDPDSGQVLGTFDVSFPTAIATGAGGRLFVYQPKFEAGVGSGLPTTSSGVIEYDPAGTVVETTPTPEVEGSIGLATSSACGVEDIDLFLGNQPVSNPFVNLYGSLPDPEICPPPVFPPAIEAQFTTAVDTAGATVRAKVNPRFWPDTRYFVQYGTGKCSEGGCEGEKPASPGSLLTDSPTNSGTTTPEILLEGLQSNTTYHYRFVTESGGGGPVLGEEKSFRTLPLAEEANTACPNQDFRFGASAKLPDCRAYELVSPLDKNNGDVATGEASFSQAAEDGGRVTFNSFRAFADPEAAPLGLQYLAERGSGGWSTRAISPPRQSFAFYAGGATASAIQYKEFSSDLCSGWVIQDTDLALVPGAPAGVAGLYRRALCGPSAYELLTLQPPPGFFTGVEQLSPYIPEQQGASADGSRSAFRVNASLAVQAGDPRPPFRCLGSAEAGTLSYRWLREGNLIPGAEAATFTPTAEDAGTVVQCQATVTNEEGASAMTGRGMAVEPIGAVMPPRPPLTKQEFGTPIGGAITGTPRVGQTLTCTPGTWGGSPTFSYRWLRSGAQITGAEAPTYTPVNADKGKALQCEILGTNAGGVAASDTEAVTIEARTAVPTSEPTISGTATVGQTLTCEPGTWTNNPVFTYKWLRSGTEIATASTYVLQAADEGKALQCQVRGANSDGGVLAATDPVIVPPPPGTTPPQNTIAPQLSGTARVGEELTCEAGTWSGTPTLTRKWLNNGNPFGPTGETYELTGADRGRAIQCQVTATNPGGTVAAFTAPLYVNPAPPSTDAHTFTPYQVYLAHEGELALVSVLPDGTPANGHSSVGSAQALSLGGNRENSLYGAVAADGSRVFWSYKPGTGAAGAQADHYGPLYLRLNATEPQSAIAAGECTEAAKGCTLPVSELISPAPARFLAGDFEGTGALFSLDPDGPGPQKDVLYEYEAEEVGGQWVGEASEVASGFQGLLGASKDLGRVYFVSTEVLTGGETNEQGIAAEAGEMNLYLGAAGGFVFVARLAAADAQISSIGVPPSAVALNPKFRVSRVSPDGSHVAFTSTASLTGYDNADLVNEEPAAEVFLYEAPDGGGEGRMLCLSCNPSGSRPRSRLVFTGNNGAFELWSAAILPPWTSQTHPGNALSDNGGRVLFNAYDSLVRGDSNGKLDVYEWEAPGEGSCTEESSAFSEQNGGCIYLISSGQSPVDSELFDATPDGSDVFFATQSSLLPRDYGLTDVYDARVGGGFPPPVSPPPACEGEACQGTPEAPNDPTPASSAFQGAGNVKEATPRPRCPKGKVRRKGRCVKKHSKHSKRGKAKKQAKDNTRGGR